MNPTLNRTSAVDPRHRPEAIAERILPADRRRGRGAATNTTGRFELQKREAFDDGWTAEEAPEPLATEVTWEKPKAIITRNELPDIGFDRSINPYRGCEHGCFYCYARPTHTYLGLSAGLDFETKLFAKEGAAELLARELASPKYRPAPIAFGANTDPYQPIERQYRITRSLIETLSQARHPLTIVTKSNLVLRDLDLLAPMARDGLVKVFVSVTTLDRGLARQMEPRAPTPQKRLEAIEALNDAGVPAGVMAAPVIPAINDEELETILTRAYSAGAARGKLCRAAAAERIARHVPRMAASPLSRPAQARGVADAVDARGQGLRSPVGPAHGRLRPLRLDDRAPVRDGRAPAWLPRNVAGAAHGPVPQAGRRADRGRRAAQPVLTRRSSCPAGFGPGRDGGGLAPGRVLGSPAARPRG